MSLFLGHIHYWLYNKIHWFEAIEEEIIQVVGKKEPSIDEIVAGIRQSYGEPTNNQKLEEIIDTSNIHGWLQQKIENAELRQAALVTELLKRNPNCKEDLTEIFVRQGKAAAQEYTKVVNTPEDAFNALNDFILEGMPCDRVNQIVAKDEDTFIWETTMCLHKHHWERVGGDVQNFYDLRVAWIGAFVSTIHKGFIYEKTENGYNKISRV